MCVLNLEDTVYLLCIKLGPITGLANFAFGGFVPRNNRVA